MELHIREILNYLDKNRAGYRYVGDSNLTVKGFCSLKHLKGNSIFWVKNAENFIWDPAEPYENMLLVIHADQVPRGLNGILCTNPKGVFFDILENFFGTRRESRIEKTSVVETRQIGEDVYIGHHCYIGKGVKIGDHVTIMHNVTVTCPAEIGDHTILHSGVVLGEDGFGYWQDKENKNRKVFHFGGVKLGMNVEVEAGSCIDRGTLDDTVIGERTKIAALCSIGHNVQIGQDVLITGGTVICGSCVIEDDVYIAPQTVVKNQCRVEKGAYIGMGSVVIHDIKAGQKVFGNPARKILAPG